MRQKLKFDIYPIWKEGSKSARHPDNICPKPKTVTTTGLHAFIGRFNKLKNRDLIGFTVFKAKCLILALSLTGCVTSYHPRKPDFNANKQLQGKLLSYDPLKRGRVQINALLVSGDTIHYLTQEPLKVLRLYRPGDPMTFRYDSTRHVKGDTLPGRLIFNP